VPNIESVATDMDAHTLTVNFDDEKTSVDAVVTALNKAGYTVPSYKATEGTN
jgi:copper chaperone CopZ